MAEEEVKVAELAAQEEPAQEAAAAGQESKPEPEQPTAPVVQAAVSEPDPDKITAQIKHYFSEYNIRRDKFIREESAKSEGWIPIATLLTFNRLKQLTTDVELIVKLTKERLAGLVEVSEDGLKLRRDQALPVVKGFKDLTEEESAELNSRTVHVKGFPKDNSTPSLDEFNAWAAQYGEVEGVEVRRLFHSKKFKGCIFVTYKSVEDAQKLLAVELLKYKDDCSLLKEDRNAYCARKKEFWEKKKETREALESKKSAKNGGEEGDEENAEADPVEIHNAVLKLSGLPAGTDFAAIKTTLAELSGIKVSYVENVNDKGETLVRFSEELKGGLAALSSKPSNGSTDLEEVKQEAELKSEDAAPAPAAPEEGDEVPAKEPSAEPLGSIQINGIAVQAALLTGDDEVTYWKKLAANRSSARRSKHQASWKRNTKRGYKKSYNDFNKGGNRKRGNQGFGHGVEGGAVGGGDGVPQNKVIKFEE